MMANFGVSAGDFVTLGTLAWNLYRSCKTASAEFEEVAREVISLHTAIKELEDDADRPRSLLKEASITKKQELNQLVNNTKSLLQQLDKLVTKYHSLSTKHRKKWDIFKFGQEGLMEIRSKIVFHTSAINLFLTSLSTESLSRIERKLDEIVLEFRCGDREASTVACLEDDVPEAEEQWSALKKELVDDGFTKQIIETHKTWIKARLREMIDNLYTAAQGAVAGLDEMSADASTKPLFFYYDPVRRIASNPMTRLQNDDNHTYPFFPPHIRDDAEPQAAKRRASSPPEDEQRTRFSPFQQSGYPSMPVYDGSHGPRFANSFHGSSHQLHRTGSNASMAGSVHSDVSEYNPQGLLTRRTITTTNSYVADAGLASTECLGTPLHLHTDDDRGSSSPASNRLENSTPRIPPTTQASVVNFKGRNTDAREPERYECEHLDCSESYNRPETLFRHVRSHDVRRKLPPEPPEPDTQLRRLTWYLHRAVQILRKTGKTDIELESGDELCSPEVFLNVRTGNFESWDIYEHELERMEEAQGIPHHQVPATGLQSPALAASEIYLGHQNASASIRLQASRAT